MKSIEIYLQQEMNTKQLLFVIAYPTVSVCLNVIPHLKLKINFPSFNFLEFDSSIVSVLAT